MGIAAAGSMTLPSELDIKAAIPLATELLALRGRDVAIDASQIERVGAQCLQVLLSAAATWHADGADFTLSAPSAPFSDAVRLAGLDLSDFSSRNH
ncbi:STAS domain-containing protein [Aerobium aerolatum]|uniref:Chemotaxis protein CheX n=1 Tax=Aquamicrobium aerolatum DSM 21857 TaxID=1121003 RepID=A0A1I3J311_9HYPH|nr:STAS domain-containing protein [Aquamicrobium aerolatum]SFI54539.1 chemotaxis protein CheX [Aquamicrobium aerolatum DSM 21857]